MLTSSLLSLSDSSSEEEPSSSPGKTRGEFSLSSTSPSESSDSIISPFFFSFHFLIFQTSGTHPHSIHVYVSPVGILT